MFFFNGFFYILAIMGMAAAKDPEPPAAPTAPEAPSRFKSFIITRQLNILRGDTQLLTHELDMWNKTLSGALPISAQTENVLCATRDAAIIISKKSRVLDIPGGLHVKRNTINLMKDLIYNLGKLAELKEDFKRIGLARTVLNSLIEQQAASKEMTRAIVPKLPTFFGRIIGRSWGRKIDKLFQWAIDEYKDILVEDLLNGRGEA